MSAIQLEIEAMLARAEPDVEVLLVAEAGHETLRLFIDHPDGVSLALCERVTRHLAGLRHRYAIEVSSPGQKRPLTKPAHFRRFLGRRVRVRTREPLTGHSERTAACSVSGELVGASDVEVTIAAHDGLLAIPYAQIVRSNLLGGE